MLQLGDNAVVTAEIRRVDGRGTIQRGERVKILSVCNTDNAQVVDIESYSGVVMRDIVCLKNNARQPLRASS